MVIVALVGRSFLVKLVILEASLDSQFLRSARRAVVGRICTVEVKRLSQLLVVVGVPGVSRLLVVQEGRDTSFSPLLLPL